MSHTLPHPDPLPLREVLRGLRHGLRRSRRALRDAVPSGGFPGPAGLIAGPVLEGLDTLASGLDAAGTDLARRLLGGGAHRVPAFDVLLADPDQEDAFAEAAYAALRGALSRMGDGDAFVSEAAARGAFARDGWAEAEVPDAAADLALRLLDAQVVRDVAPSPTLRVPIRDVPAIAVAAALLWLMADRQDGASGADAEFPTVPDAALDAATDLAVALAPRVIAATSARDASRLAAVLGRFAPHV